MTFPSASFLSLSSAGSIVFHTYLTVPFSSLMSDFKIILIAGEILTPKRKWNSASRRTSSLVQGVACRSQHVSNNDEEVCCRDWDNRQKRHHRLARKTMIQTLCNSGFNTESIMEKSGHKNMSSGLNYSVVTDEEQQKMTKVLMGCGHVSQGSTRTHQSQLSPIMDASS